MIDIMLRPEHGGNIGFQRVADAILWVQSQIQQWSTKISTVARSMEDRVRVPVQNWSRVLSNLEDHRRANTDGDYVQDERLNPTIMVGSLVGLAFSYVIENLSYESVQGAAASLGWGGTMNWSSSEQVAGVVAVDRIIKNIQDREKRDVIEEKNNDLYHLSAKLEKVSADITGLENQIAEIGMAAAEQTSLLDSKSGKMEAILSTKMTVLETEILSAQSELNSLKVLTEDNFAKAIKDGQDQVQAWVLAQMEQTRLEAPVTLWNDRSKAHQKASDRIRLVALAVGAAGLGMTYCVASGSYTFSGQMFADAIVGTTINSSQLAPHLRATFHFQLIFSAAATLFWLTMYLWMMRIIIRRHLSELHLATDASGRAALTQTYLGLIKEGAATDTERAIVMGAIFQPVTGGAASDDGPPAVSLPSLVAAIVSSKSPI